MTHVKRTSYSDSCFRVHQSVVIHIVKGTIFLIVEEQVYVKEYVI